MKKFTKILALILAAVMLISVSVPVLADSIDIALEANGTTGFYWDAYTMAGNSVFLEMGEYVTDESDAAMVGVGGTQHLYITGIQPGQSLVRLIYMRSSGEIAEEKYLLCDVDDDCNVSYRDISDSCAVQGKVTAIDSDNKSVTLDSVDHGEIVAVFAEDLDLPLLDENVILYTDGAMTLSIPAMINVLAWSTVSDDHAREEAAQPEITELVRSSASDLISLISDKAYIKLFTGAEEVIEIISAFADDCSGEPIDVQKIDDGLLDAYIVEILFSNDFSGLGPVAQSEMTKRLYNPTALANQASASSNPYEIAAASICSISNSYPAEYDSEYYLVKYTEEKGVLVGIYNNGLGVTTVSSSIITNIAALEDFLGK